MEPSFGWVSLAPKALAMARAQLTDKGQGVRDEIGFLVLHQRYADRFFPGTSVLHTRLRYALFVPWQFEDQAGKPPSAAQNGLRSAETALAKRLKDAGETGVIGGLTWPRAADQPPSMIYWSALNAWGLLRRDFRGRAPTRSGAHARLAGAARAVDDDGEPLGGYDPPFISLPRPRGDWTVQADLTFRFHADEQAFLRERLGAVMAPEPLTHPSLLAQLVRNDVQPPRSLWSRPVTRHAGRDASPLARARAAASLAAVGRGIYAALVEDLRDRRDGRETPNHHRAWLSRILAEHGDVALELVGDGLTRVEEDVGPLPPSLRCTLADTLKWLAAGAADVTVLLATYEAAERRKGLRARLSDTAAAQVRRAEWDPVDHPIGYPLHYRWDTVRTLLTDLRASTW